MADLNQGEQELTSDNKQMWAFLRRDRDIRRKMPYLAVHNIPKHLVTKELLQAEFGPDVNVKKIKFAGWTPEGQSPLFAFVEFHERTDLRTALTTVNGTDSPYIELSEIPRAMSEDDVREWFKECGEIEDIRIVDCTGTQLDQARRVLVIFRRVDGANRAVAHLCNLGLGTLPFRICALVTQTEYQLPPNAVYIAAERQQNLGLHAIRHEPFFGQFSDKKHPPAYAPRPSAPAPALAAPPAPVPAHAALNQQQLQRNQQPVQPRLYQLPPRAPTLHAGQQHAGAIERQPPPLQVGPHQQQQRQMQQQGNQQALQPRPNQLPPPAQQQQQQPQIPLHGNRLPSQPVTYQPPTQVQAGPNLQPQQQLAVAFQWQQQPVHRGQYPLAVPVFYAAPIPQQQLAPLGRFTLLVREIPYYFKDTDVLEIFQRYSYSGSLIEAKIQLCTQALTQPHATVTYGLRNDADQAIQNLHLKYLQRSPTDPTPIIFTVEPYDY